MRDRLGVLLMEEESGEVVVQLFADPDKLAESFAQLNNGPSDPPRRATCILLEYVDGKIEARTKELPVPEPPKEDAPDGYRLGVGPIWIEKENDETDRNNKERGIVISVEKTADDD